MLPLACGVLLCTAAWMSLKYREARREYRELETLLENVDQQDEIERLNSQLRDAKAQAELYRSKLSIAPG